MLPKFCILEFWIPATTLSDTQFMYACKSKLFKQLITLESGLPPLAWQGRPCMKLASQANSKTWQGWSRPLHLVVNHHPEPRFSSSSHSLLAGESRTTSANSAKHSQNRRPEKHWHSSDHGCRPRRSPQTFFSSDRLGAPVHPLFWETCTNRLHIPYIHMCVCVFAPTLMCRTGSRLGKE